MFVSTFFFYFSIRATAFAKHGLDVQNLSHERDQARAELAELRARIRSLEEEQELTGLAVEYSDRRHEEVMDMLSRVRKERKEAVREFRKTKQELDSTKQQLTETERLLAGTQHEMVEAWLQTEEGKARLADESVDANTLGQEEGVNRLKAALQMLHPSIEFGPIFEKYEEIRQQELNELVYGLRIGTNEGDTPLGDDKGDGDQASSSHQP